MGKYRSHKFEGDSGRYPAVLVAGGILFYGLPSANALEAERPLPALRPSQQLEQAAGAPAAFQEESGWALNLLSSAHLAASASEVSAAPSDPPFPPAELPLRLASILTPARPGASRQPRWTSSGDQGLILGVSREVSLTALAVESRPAPVPDSPSRPTEFPLRLAQVMVPRSGAARMPRWGTVNDTGMSLGISREIGGEPPVVQGMPGRPRAEPLLPQEPPAEGGFLGKQGAGRDMVLAPPPPTPTEEAASGTGTGWVIPPIPWGGSVGYMLRQQTADGNAKSVGHFMTANLRASSYIYAPWLASLSGSLGVTSGVSRSQSGQGAAVVNDESGNKSITGYGTLDVLPSTRYPFSAYVNRSDTRTSSNVVTTDSTSTRVGMRQSYRTEDGKKSFSGLYDHSTVQTQNGAKDTVDAISGSYAIPFGPFTNSTSLRLSVSDRQGTGEGASLFQANSSHSAQFDDNISLQAYSNLLDNNLRYSGANGSIVQTRGQYLQMGASGSWRPEFEDDDDLPLSLNGGVSYLSSRTGGDTGTSQAQQLGGNAAAYYRFSQNLSGGVSGSLNRFATATGETRMMSMMNSNVSYMGTPLTFGKYSYNWNTGANVNWMSGSGQTPSAITTGQQGSHSVGRNWLLSGRDSLSLSLSQAASAYQSQTTGNSTSLSHNATASYYLGLGDQFNGNVNAMFSDVLSSGVNDQHYRNLNVAFSGSGQLNARSSASINLLFHWSDQKMRTVSEGIGFESANQNMTLSGSASYSHLRFFGVPGLRYTLAFTADTLLRDERLMGNADASANRARYSLDNRLEYRIGRLETRSSFTVSDSGGKKNALLFFQVTRQIGSF